MSDWPNLEVRMVHGVRGVRWVLVRSCPTRVRGVHAVRGVRVREVREVRGVRGVREVRGVRALLSVVLAVALACVASPARAQGTDSELSGERVTRGWVFTPSMAVGVSFDDNPVLASHGNPSTSDVIGMVRPSGQLAFNRKFTHVGLGYYGTLVRYRELDQFDNYDQRASIDFRHQPSKRVTLFGRNSYMDTPVTDAIQVAGVPFFRTGTRHDEAEVGLSVLATRRLEVRSSYRFQWLEFNRPPTAAESLLQGGRSHGVTLDVRQHVSDRVRVGAAWDYRHATLGQTAGAFDIQNAEALLEWQASPTVVVEGGGGVSYLSLPASLGTKVGPAAHVSLRKRTEYAFLTLSAMRSFVPAFSFGGSLRNQEVSAGIRVPLAGRRAYVQSSLAYRDSQPVLERELGLRAFWIDATAGFVVQRWMRIEAFYAGAFQDTSVAGGRVDRNRVGVQFVTSRSMRFE